ncbi:MAG: ABC transporter permease [Carboxylicivirga sp.]|jgi:putative ABC transport system permease protein|nr:ABC transporter permease [Carboxylicivirga sp.]
MLWNNLKLTWKVLQRRKLYSFISLFGITFTLTILMVFTSAYDFVVNPNYPDLKQDRILYINSIWLHSDKENTNSYMGPPGYALLDKYVKRMEIPERISIYSFMNTQVQQYINNKKVKLGIKYVDAEFWKILDFEFYSGKAFSQQQLDQTAQVAVISQTTANKFFEDEQNPIGRYIEVDKTTYCVVGVVKNVPISRMNSNADIWVPLSCTKKDLNDPKLHGDFACMMLAKNETDFDRINHELQSQICKIVFPKPDHQNKIHVHAEGFLEGFVRASPFGGSRKPGMLQFYGLLTGITLLFLSFPAISLVNLNMNRIMERISEIGVRKSFGANKVRLIRQFLMENILITLMGGVLAMLVTTMIIKGIQYSQLIPGFELFINYRILFWGLLYCLAFGVISGAVPAIKMARMSIVNALNKRES